MTFGGILVCKNVHNFLLTIQKLINSIIPWKYSELELAIYISPWKLLCIKDRVSPSLSNSHPKVQPCL